MKTRYIFLSAIVLLLSSCAKEGMEQVEVPGDAIRLASYRQQVVTRADVDELAFAKDTKYTLLAVNASTDPTAYAWATQKGFTTQPQAGTESEDHAILYSPVSIFSVGKHLDFYGLTYDKTDSAPSLDAAAADGVNPTISLSESSDRLPDLMHSNTVKNRTYTDGIITMPFEHALAAVNFYISKQDEDGDNETARQLERVKVTEIRLDNVATAATMDVVDGKWSWTASAQGSRVVYSDASGMVVPKIAEPIGDTDVLVFPNDDYVDTNNAYDSESPYKYYTPAGDGSANKCEQVIVTVKLEGLEEWDNNIPGYKAMNKRLTCGAEVVNGAVEISFPLRNYHETTGEDVGPLHFLRNHKYVLSVFVMRDNVRIVAISPQVYEWVSVDLNSLEFDRNVTTLGQPVTFGGTVWMDRNLGAKSADCEHDYIHTLGYYWEYARNIPFILDPEVFLAGYDVPDKLNDGSANNNHFVCHKSDHSKALGTSYTPGSDTPVVAFPDYLIYTWDQNGNKVSKVETKMLSQYSNYVMNSDAATLGKIVAINPGDTGSYAFIAQSRTDVGSTLGVGSGDQRNWCDFRENTHLRNYWYSVENQPVPKGWRLPTGKDVYSIMPEDNFKWFFNGKRFRQVGVGKHGNVTGPRTTTGTALQYCGEYQYQYFYGSFEVDKSGTGDYSTPIYNDKNITRVYGIKYQGTSKAYRYMIEVHDSNIKNCGFVRFSMFPATASDKFLCDKTTKDAISTDDAQYNLYSDNPKWNLHKFDWDHPSSYIDFPLQGQIEYHPMHINLFGRDLKLRLMETYAPNSSGTMTDNYCMKLSNDGTGFYGTWHSTTCPTRLVRDM